jgi:hypothetical protein
MIDESGPRGRNRKKKETRTEENERETEKDDNLKARIRAIKSRGRRNHA